MLELSCWVRSLLIWFDWVRRAVSESQAFRLNLEVDWRGVLQEGFSPDKMFSENWGVNRLEYGFYKGDSSVFPCIK